MPIIAGPIIAPEPGQHLDERVAGSARPRWWCWLLTERRGEVGEQRPVRLERLARPLAAGDDARLGKHRVGPGDVVDVHRGDPRQLGVGDAHLRVDVGLGLALGRAEHRELAGRVPVERALTLQGLGDLAEHRERRERVGRESSALVGSVALVGPGSSAITREATGVAALQPLRPRRAPVRRRRGVAICASARARDAACTCAARAAAWDGASPTGSASSTRSTSIVASGDVPAEPASGPCDTVVDVGLADHDLLGRRGESVTEGAAELLADAARCSAPTRSSWCRRRWSTARSPTTRSRSPRRPCCGPTRRSSTPASWRRPRRWSRSGGRRARAGASPCCARRSRSPPTARRRWRGR